MPRKKFFIEAENLIHARFNLECFMNEAVHEDGYFKLYDFDGNELIRIFTQSPKVWEMNRYIIDENI